jgi:hypothetical protein
VVRQRACRKEPVGRLETRPLPRAPRLRGAAANRPWGASRGGQKGSGCGKKRPPKGTDTTPAKTTKFTPMPCPTPCRARVQGEYSTVAIPLSISHWRGEDRRWKAPGECSTATAAGCRLSSAAPAIEVSVIAPAAAPKRRAEPRCGMPAAVTKAAGEAASSMPKEPVVTACASRM